MRTVFPKPARVIKGKVFGKTNYALGVLDESVLKLNNHMRRFNRYVPNDSIFVSMIVNLPAFSGTNCQRYYEKVELVADELGAAVNITTPFKAGATFTNELFGKDSLEVYIQAKLNRIEFGENGDYPNWHKLKPVRILTHPSSSDLLRPVGDSYRYVADGHCVCAVDIAALAVMYFMWQKYQQDRPPEDREDITSFIYKFVYSSMLEDFASIMVFNRFANHYFEKSNEELLGTSTIALVRAGDKLTKGFPEISQFFSRSKYNIDELLDNLPVYNGKVLRDLLPNLDIPSTRQVYWAVLAAYEPYIDFLVRYNLLNGFRGDRRITGKLRKEIRTMMNDRVLDKCPDKDLREYLELKYSAFESILD